MKNNKLKLTLLLTIVLCIFSILVFTGCKDEEESEEIEILVKASNSPRLTYVQGQELDLSTGSITCLTNGKESSVALNAEGVTVTGYDKDKLGSQKLTVTYSGKTTEITVNVIPRVKAEGYETKYFKDDTFDKTKGKLVVARDDATTFSVNMNNDKISLVSFDSSEVGVRKVNVKYTDGSKEYTCSFDVNVYGVESVKLTSPTKTAYSSHETELDFTGGFLTVKSTADGNLTKYVYLTKDMVKGFNISAATKENTKDNPLEQELTITYGGQNFTFKIKITYSGISIIKDIAKDLSAIDFEDEDATISQAQGDAAIEAITEYYKLSASQKALISKDDTETVVRTAALCLSTRYVEEFKNYSNILSVGANTAIYLVSSDYEKSLAELNKLKDEDEKLNVYADLLRNILADFPDTVIAQEKTVEDVVKVHTTEIHDLIIDIFEHLTSLYELLDDIPDNWTDADLEANANNIMAATTDIRTDDFVKNGYGYLYEDILSPWRANDDFLDIIYHYYLYVKKDTEFIKESMFENVPLPDVLNDWYNNLIYAYREAKWLADYESSTAYLADVTFFMYYYYETLEASELCKSSENKLYTDLYEVLDCDGYVDNLLRIQGYGYLYHCGSMIDSQAFMNAWEKYLVLIDIYVTDTLDKTENDAEFRAALNAFMQLSPSELYGFISSLNFLYDTSRGSVLVMEYGDNPKNIFIDMIGQYCYHVLNDNSEPIFVKLIMAMESYSLFDIKDSALDDFMATMKEVIDAYEALSTEDQNNFHDYLGVAYDKYVNIYNVVKELTTASTGNKDAEFTELYDLVTKFHKVYDYIQNADENTDTEGLYGLLIAIYERSKVVYNDIVSTGDKNAIAALYAKSYTINETEVTLDNAFFSVRAIFIKYMFNVSYKVTDSEGNSTTYIGWDIYSKSNASEYFAKAVYLMYSAFDSEANAPEISAITALMAELRELSNDSLNIFCAFDGDVYYYRALRAVFEANLSENAKAIGDNLVQAEIAYISYILTEDETHLETFKTKMSEVVSAYATAVTETDKQYVEALYNYYNSIYEELNKATE